MIAKVAITLILAAGVATSASAQSGPTDQGPTLLLHGNYCGPGNNAPAAPIDALDAACARHDACTPRHGLPSTACNARLQQDATRISQDPHEPEDVRSLAELVASGASILPADPKGAATASLSAPRSTRAYTSVTHRSQPAPSEAVDTDDAGAK